jgi:PPIC-type PPIASE domain
MSAAGEMAMQRGHSQVRAHWLLLCGAAAGVILAAADVLREPAPEPSLSSTASQAKSPEPLPADAVARVNGRLIRIQDFKEVLAVEIAGGMSPDAAAKQRLLEEMIDEELRVQHALKLNLHLTDSRVRMDLASAVTEAVIARAEQEVPDERVLREYFDERRDSFARRGPLRVRQIWIGIVAGNLGEAYNRARAAVKLLREKESFETVQRSLGNKDPRPIPGTLLHPDELAGYIGPLALDTALTLEPGEISDPIRAVDGFHVLQVLERRPSPAVSFESSRSQVVAEYWRERARRALEANAAELRENADIQRARTF